jgi:uncharacterized protein (TIGR02147 family)
MKTENKSSIDIFDYFDYREYLQMEYTWRKEHDNGFSHRFFSSQAGISSPNYLSRVLKGERTLSIDYCEKFSKALGLTLNESKYFTTLVQFNNEHGTDEKERLLRTLLSLRNRRGIHKIDDKKLQFFSKWYYPVIRELAVIIEWNNDYNLLARHCIPRITAQQAKDAVAYLLKTDFLNQECNGIYHRTEPVISSGDEVRSTVLRNYHRQTLAQSIDALDTVSVENRDISSLTLSVSRKTYAIIKKEVQDFRKRLLVLAKEDANPEIVCLTGFQLIPRSKIAAVKRSKMK